MADTRPAAPTWDRRRWVLLLVLSGNMILDAIEGSILVPALGVLTTDLTRSIGQTQWLLSGFAAGFAALLLAGPALAARFGRRQIYLVAMALFAVASVIGGLTDDLALLVATRVVKGAAAGLTAPAGLAVIAAEFPAGAQQRRAISVYAAFGAAGFTTGLLLSGWLTALNWHLLFVFPAPIALALLVAAWRVIPDPPVAAPPRLSKPLLRNGSLARSALGAGALNGGYLALLVVVAVQLHQSLGWVPWQIAVGLLPASLPLALSVPFAGRFVERYGTARLILAGAVATLAGHLLLFARPEIHDYGTDALPVLLLIEGGFVLSFAALNMQSTATVPAELRPIAVPLYQTGVQFGAAFVLPIAVGTAVAFDAYRPAAAVIAVAGLLAVLAASSELRASAASVPAKAVP
ncbi:MFS transporter [Nocardia fluminea]|uniref:Putative MFS family arabinose efflux permease n=1 Tax=Nocardia fluminea TaxID=134984 RepID=A0A2N3V5I2_9NOCA|nr:MFS transporter [Nocardia fluminea]PKV76851.1 putative MFS family arabinose efflux permease [Nocardia fluminea]